MRNSGIKSNAFTKKGKFTLIKQSELYHIENIDFNFNIVVHITQIRICKNKGILAMIRFALQTDSIHLHCSDISFGKINSL